MTNKKNKQHRQEVNSTIARSDDGSIQITYTIPFKDIKKTEDKVLEELKKDIDIPGFRKGQAPIEKVKTTLSKETLIEKTLSKLLPVYLSDSINTHKLNIATYPKFELLSANENEDWQVRATTCELPEVNLDNYKEIIVKEARVKNIWTPQKGKEDIKQQDEKTNLQKEEEIIKLLLNTIKVKIPKVLIEEEVNARLSQLLEKIEKLGLNLDSYLSSVGKTAQSIREEYTKQASDSISLELILNTIAQKENLSVSQQEIDSAIQASATTDRSLEEKLKTPEQQRLIKNILNRRKALDFLTSLI